MNTSSVAPERLVVLVAACRWSGTPTKASGRSIGFPKAAIKQALGVDLSDQWIERVQQASVRFPSGSGSFVSPDGLVLTNHHVSLDLLHKMSTPERDYASKGFLAADRSQELKAADLELMSLQKIEDVTAKVNEAVKPGMSSAETLAARRSAIAAIEKDSQEKTGLEAEVVTLYQGGQYHLYLYKKFTDVRLVFAPEFDAAFYGGDPDNFTFPRYCLDMTIWRVYENGKPFQTKNYLPWSTTGVKEGDAVFTSGHPGATQRLNTVAHLEFLRDQALPLSINAFTADPQLARRLHEAGRRAGAPGQRRFLRHREFAEVVEGTDRRAEGRGDDEQEARRREGAARSRQRECRAEGEVRRCVGPGREGARRAAAVQPRARVLRERPRPYTQYFTLARTLVRWTDESAKPNGQRLPEYSDARKAAIERQIGVGSADLSRRGAGEARSGPGGHAADSSARTTRS